MGKPLYVHDFGLDADGLKITAENYRVIIDSDVEMITVEYRLVEKGPVTDEVKKFRKSGFTRYNRYTTYYEFGQVITEAIYDVNGVEITPAVISDGTEVKVIEKLKFDELRAHPVGQMIIGMIKANYDDFAKGFETLDLDLKQD